MRPSFNTAGPCVPGEHYMLPPGDRVKRALELVDDGKYFSLIAGHQSGKTTCLQWMADFYNAGDRLRAVWVDLETARDTPDLAVAMPVVLDKLLSSTERTLPGLTEGVEVDALLKVPGTALLHVVQALAGRCSLPLVLLFDEADGLVGATMVSFLSQLRDGYLDRSKAPFAYGVALVGRRAVRDYSLSTEERRAVALVGSSSPFNVNAEVASVELFTPSEVEGLLGQHTARTGQRFEADASARVFELSQGQPWLVNAMADYAVDRLLRDRALAVTRDHIDAAKEAIILERRTHLDALVARLREERVRRILDPMVAGARLSPEVLDDDLEYARGLGLVRIVEGRVEIANPIYREVVPRALSYVQQVSLYQKTEWYVGSDGALDVPKLMAAWQTFWRKDGHLAAEGFAYRESGPHLMLMAFLQRIVNGGGRVEREYALGKGALDLLVEWEGGAGLQRVPIEVKLRRDTETEDEALEQVRGYLESLGLREGWLVVFDLRATTPWSERLFTRERAVGGCAVRVVGC